MEDSILYLFTAILGLLVLLSLGGTVSLGRRAGTPRAPRGLPFLGHALTLRRWGPGRGDRLLATLRRWAEAYGGAFQLRNPWLGRLLLGGPRVVVVLSDPAAVHSLLALGEDVAVKSRRHYSVLDRVLHPDAVPSSATAPSSQHWGVVRRSLLHAFSRAELQQDFEVAKVKALALARIVAGLGPGVVLDVDDAARRLSLDVAGLSKLGYDFEAVEAEGEVLLLRLLGEVSAEWDARLRRLLPSALAPWLSDAAAAGQTKCRILQEFIAKELWDDIEARGPPPADDVTLAAQLARLRSPPSRGSFTPAGLSLERTHSELAAQLLLAAQPTGHAIAWALYCLAGNKAVQDKLMAELKREGIFAKPQDLTYDTIPKLPYLDCVVRETLRLYPTQPCPATVRTLKKDVVLAGWRLSAGDEVWVDVFSMHRSPRHWRDPDRFNPERWWDAAEAETSKTRCRTTPYDGLDTVEPDPTADDDKTKDDGDCSADGGGRTQRPGSDEAAATAPESEDGGDGDGAAPPMVSPLSYMPFGSGPRSCLGQRLAVAEMKAVLAVLLSCLSFERSGEGGDSEAARAWQGLFLRPAGGLHLLVAPRKRG